MPSWEFINDMVVPAVLYMMLPALASAALVMAAVTWLGGARQAAAGAALALCVGVFVGLWCRDAIPLLRNSPTEALAKADNVLTLNPGDTTWNRLPWVVLGVLCVGRLAYLADVHSSDGWLLRGGAAIALTWWLIPEDTRVEFIWLAPAFALVVGLQWLILDRLAAQPGSSSVAVCMILALLLAAQILGLQAHCALFMEVLVVFAFAFTGIAAVAWLRGVEFGGAVPGVAVAFLSLLLMGQRVTDSKLEWFHFALPAGVPFLLGLTLPLTKGPKLRLHLLRLALASALLGAAAALASQVEPLRFSDE